MSHLPPQHVVDSALDSQSRPVPYPRPAEGAPNVLMIVLDDVGFAQLGCFGSGISTPRIDEVAGGGLRYQRFHVTAVCSSTRAALLTGRNHHAVGMGVTEEAALGFPGYTGRIPRSAATMARLLKDTGYNTMAVGKWHLGPRTETSAAGPFDRWPLGVGFEKYYGFLGSETGLFYGGDYKQLVVQIVIALFALIFTAIVTVVIALALKPLGWRVSDEEEANGIDEAEHAETAYDFA